MCLTPCGTVERHCEWHPDCWCCPDYPEISDGTGTGRAYWRDSLVQMKNRGNLSCFQLFVFLRLLCLSTKNKFTHYIFLCGALATVSTICCCWYGLCCCKEPQSNLYFKNDFRTLFRIWICIFISVVVVLCACFLASFLFVFCVFSLFILSTLNKYHEKFQRSLTSNRKICAKRKQIARNWTGKCLTNFKPNQARLAVSSDELQTHFPNDFWIILIQFENKFVIAVRIKRDLNINIVFRIS